ncbi:TIGR03086 family metal-binding protein [Streptomyces sp. GSL17-111]|uniref:TIGR03086 family metal-binding protein n=1 Tax=Streptomyces sp. GSL17-111 TaxID=3121596 RepID=UPI0030F41E23
MPRMTDLGPAASSVETLLPAVDDTRLGAPTPCRDYAVSALLQHLVELTEAFRDAADKRFTPLTDSGPDPLATPLAADWRVRLPRQLRDLAAAFRHPAAWEGRTRAGGVELTGEEAGYVALGELVLHGWDLAVATGQPYPADPDAVAASVGLLESFGPGTEGGPFGPPVPVPDGASPLERAVALSGRDPHWAPADR